MLNIFYFKNQGTITITSNQIKTTIVYVSSSKSDIWNSYDFLGSKELGSSTSLALPSTAHKAYLIQMSVVSWVHINSTLYLLMSLMVTSVRHSLGLLWTTESMCWAWEKTLIRLFQWCWSAGAEESASGKSICAPLLLCPLALKGQLMMVCWEREHNCN